MIFLVEKQVRGTITNTYFTSKWDLGTSCKMNHIFTSVLGKTEKIYLLLTIYNKKNEIKNSSGFTGLHLNARKIRRGDEETNKTKHRSGWGSEEREGWREVTSFGSRLRKLPYHFRTYPTLPKKIFYLFSYLVKLFLSIFIKFVLFVWRDFLLLSLNRRNMASLSSEPKFGNDRTRQVGWDLFASFYNFVHYANLTQNFV